MDYALLITFFSYIVLVSYTAFVSPQWLETRVLVLRTRFLRPRRADSVQRETSTAPGERAPDRGTVPDRCGSLIETGPFGS